LPFPSGGSVNRQFIWRDIGQAVTMFQRPVGVFIPHHRAAMTCDACIILRSNLFQGFHKKKLQHEIGDEVDSFGNIDKGVENIAGIFKGRKEQLWT
jgi:hypothetical protein